MCWTLTLLLLIGADPSPGGKTPRRPNPLAPSLPELTDAEEDRLDSLIDRFIAADTGKLQGDEAKTAMNDFKSLGPEATFALIRGFNKAASIEHSCPALTIAKKLSSTLRTTEDTQLLQYVKENLGAGVKKTRYGDVINDMKVGCTARMSAIKNQPNTNIIGTPKP